MTLLNCAKTKCNSMATHTVSVGKVSDSNGASWWVCRRHITWAMDWLAQEWNDYTVTVHATVWAKERQGA